MQSPFWGLRAVHLRFFSALPGTTRAGRCIGSKDLRIMPDHIDQKPDHCYQNHNTLQHESLLSSDSQPAAALINESRHRKGYRGVKEPSKKSPTSRNRILDNTCHGGKAWGIEHNEGNQSESGQRRPLGSLAILWTQRSAFIRLNLPKE